MAKPSRATLRRHFPDCGPCLICGCKTLGAIHRRIDAIRDRYKAEESIRSIAEDFELPYAVVRYVATAPIRELDFLRRNR